MVTMRAYPIMTFALSNSTIADPVRVPPPFPQKWGPNVAPGQTSRCLLPPDHYDRRYRQDV